MNRLLLFIFVLFSFHSIKSQTVVLDTNDKTIKYTGTTISNNRFIQANLRGSVEFFCVVDDSLGSITDPLLHLYALHHPRYPER